MGDRTTIIAEAGVNHNGNPDMAFKLVDAAVAAGADAVKFQTFRAESIATESAVKAGYQQSATGNNESQMAMLKSLELSQDLHRELFTYCQNKGIRFLSSAFDFDSLDFLVNDLKLKTLKIASGEITNGPLLLAHARSGCNIILSTGMSTMDEIKNALGVIAFGFAHGKDANIQPTRVGFSEAYASDYGQSALREKVTLLHCTTEYPAPLNEINLNSMQAMRATFKLDVGYSDHSSGITVPIAAVALGASVIEKHFTLDKTLPGPDHQASLEPDDLTSMVSAIRQVELVMGDGTKVPMPSEIANRVVARKSLVAAVDISKGDLFTEDNLAIKRPGAGRSPMEYWDLLGKQSGADYSKDEAIE